MKTLEVRKSKKVHEKQNSYATENYFYFLWKKIQRAKERKNKTEKLQRRSLNRLLIKECELNN